MRPAAAVRAASAPGAIPMRVVVALVATLHVLGCQAPSRDAAGHATTVATHLMFQEGAAEHALALYASVFPGFRVTRVERYGPGDEVEQAARPAERRGDDGHRGEMLRLRMALKLKPPARSELRNLRTCTPPPGPLIFRRRGSA